MKYRIIEAEGLFWPQYKNRFFWWGVPVRLHTCQNRYVYYAINEENAREAIKVFKEKGDISKPRIIGVI